MSIKNSIKAKIKKLLDINDQELEYMLIFSTKEKIKHQLIYKPQQWFDKTYTTLPKVEFASLEEWEEISTLRKNVGEKGLLEKVLYQFIFNINPKFMDKLFALLDLKRTISYYLFKKAYGNQGTIHIDPKTYFHYLESHQNAPKIEWLDSDSRIFYGSFQVLVDFIEFECARAHGFRPETEEQFLFLKEAYRNPTMGLKYIDEKIEFWIQNGEYEALYREKDNETLKTFVSEKPAEVGEKETIADLIKYSEKAKELREEKVEKYTLTSKNTNLPWIKNWTKAKMLYFWFKNDFKELERAEFTTDYFLNSGKMKKEKLKELVDIMDSLWI
jgi:hypothetical protein